MARKLKEDVVNNVDPPNPKKWENQGFYETYELASEKRNELLSLWSSDEEKYHGMQIKVRRRSNGSYLIKTCKTLETLRKAKKGKKGGKNSRRNRQNSERRMFDASAVV